MVLLFIIIINITLQIKYTLFLNQIYFTLQRSNLNKYTKLITKTNPKKIKCMESKEKTNNKNEFRNWLDSIPTGMYNETRARVIEECIISEQIFRHWRAGNTKIPELAKPIIEGIAGKPIFKNN